jgi:hypothetical protein
MLEVASARPEDCERVVALLSASFGHPRHAPFLQPAVMDWKYFQPRPDWAGPRSYVLSAGNRAAAHGGIVPVTFLTPRGAVRALHPIDWAAAGSPPGAGLLLWERLTELTPVLLTVGGSRDTRRILPGLGYRTVGTWDAYARVVRPWSQFRTDPYRRGWKQPFRILRNTAWSFLPAAGHPGWSCRRIERFDDSTRPLFEPPAPILFAGPARSPELLNYFLACPAAAFSAYLLIAGEDVQGWFLLSRVARQIRIADILVRSSDPVDWRSAYALAVETAAADPRCCEIAAGACTDTARQALTANGFHHRAADPVFLYDPQHLLDGLALSVEMIDSDAAYLEEPWNPYLA